MRRKKTKISFGLIFFLMITLGVVYATLQANLQINGTTKIASNTWDVHFENITVNPSSVPINTTLYEDASAARIDPLDDCKIDFNVLLSQPGDYYEFTVKVVNGGSIDAKLSSLVKTVDINGVDKSNDIPSWLLISTTYIDNIPVEANHILKSGSYETYKIRIEFSTSITEAQLAAAANSNISLSIEPQFVQSDNTAIDIPGRLQVGDYFSLTPDASSYTILSTDTDYTDDVTITPNELTLWRVIKRNANGTVDAVSEYMSSSSIYFNGPIGYKNYIKVLQDVAQQYKKEGYTDAARMVGYDGQTLVITNTGYFDHTSSEIPTTDSTPSPATGTGEEFEGGALGDTLYLKDYNLIKTVYGTMKTTKMSTSTPSEYLVASRAYTYAFLTYYGFCIKYISPGGEMISSGITNHVDGNNWTDSPTGYPVRPIITLNNQVKISTGIGTGEKATPYALTK